MKKIQSVNFGCRVNSAELNLITQKYIDQGFVASTDNPDVIVVNTCAITKKGEYESLSKIKSLQEKFPHAKIIVTGCANLSKIKPSANIQIVPNQEKTNLLSSVYSPEINDKFSHTHRYLLRVQSGCTAFCSYCIVPYRRPELWSLPINEAVEIVHTAVTNGYQEVIITGVNLNQYLPGLSNLVEALLTQTKISLISFGSIPINSIDDKFINLLKKYPDRLERFLHIPIQSGSDKILKLMNRNYTREKIISVFASLRAVAKQSLSFGTDVIVGFPGETEVDFKATLDLCQSIGFKKIHTFKYSPRPETLARKLYLQSEKIGKDIVKIRSQQIRQLTVQTTLPSRQTPEI